jgi:hypothetical protein
MNLEHPFPQVQEGDDEALLVVPGPELRVDVAPDSCKHLQPCLTHRMCDKDQGLWLELCLQASQLFRSAVPNLCIRAWVGLHVPVSGEVLFKLWGGNWLAGLPPGQGAGSESESSCKETSR